MARPMPTSSSSRLRLSRPTVSCRFALANCATSMAFPFLARRLAGAGIRVPITWSVSSGQSERRLRDETSRVRILHTKDHLPPEANSGRCLSKGVHAAGGLAVKRRAAFWGFFPPLRRTPFGLPQRSGSRFDEKISSLRLVTPTSAPDEADQENNSSRARTTIASRPLSTPCPANATLLDWDLRITNQSPPRAASSPIG